MEKFSQKTSEEVLDEAFFSQLEKVSVPVSKDVKPDNKTLTETKKSFLEGAITAPILTYENDVFKWYDEKEIVLLDLKYELNVRNDVDENVKKLYFSKINQKIAEIRMLREVQAVAKGGDEVFHMNRFKRYVEFIYGVPEQNVFNGVMNTLSSKMTKSEYKKDSVDAYERLHMLQGNFRASVDSRTEVPSFASTKNESKNQESVVTDVEELRAVFVEAIKDMGLEGEWKVIINKSGTRRNISIAAGERKVHLPASKKLQERTNANKLTAEKIKGLIAHELGTHALRHQNGSRSRLKLLSVGLGRYTKGEEGLATHREQQITGADDYSGFDNYFAAGLAKGLDGGGMRNFEQVHQVLQDYYQVCEPCDKKRAGELAWDRCIRIFRGTTGRVPGVIFTKDILYREGNIATYTFLENQGNSVVDLNVGKFDHSNPTHVQVLTELGILDKDLQVLDSNLE